MNPRIAEVSKRDTSLVADLSPNKYYILTRRPLLLFNVLSVCLYYNATLRRSNVAQRSPPGPLFKRYNPILEKQHLRVSLPPCTHARSNTPVFPIFALTSFSIYNEELSEHFRNIEWSLVKCIIYGILADV